MLFPQEARLLSGVAVKRAREFAAGRLCARRALVELGGVEVPLEVDDDRQPRWPPAFTGSITHTEGFCGAAVAKHGHIRALGLDAEIVGQVSPEIWHEIMAPPELAWMQTLPATEQVNAAALIFSAKEAFFKCQFAVTGEWLDFQAVTVGYSGHGAGVRTFVVRPLIKMALFEHTVTSLTGRYVFSNNLVFAGMALTVS